MNKRLFRWILGFLIVLILLAWACTFQLRENEVGVVTRFGNPVNITKESGLHFKWPWPVESALVLDSRRRIYNTRFRETLTRDKKNVILLTYVVWEVDDPLRFLQSVATSSEAELKLDGMISNAKNAVMGKYYLSALVSTNPDDLKFDEIEGSILNEVAPRAREKLGVKVCQIGLKRVALPEENVRWVFEQMRTERSQFSAQYVAEGKKARQAIIDQTDVQKAEILARATEEAATIRGEAESEAAKLFAHAQRKDPEFYAYLRSLDSLKQLLKRNATVILRTDSAPFDILRKGAAIERKADEEKKSSRPPGD